MGITIHYSGKLDDPRVLPELLQAARHFCFQRKWKYVDIDDRIIGTVERWVTSQGESIETVRARIDDTQRGLIIQPHPESESVFLTFNQTGELCFYLPQTKPGWYWENKYLFTKTQFAPLDIHISICELLHLIQDKYFSQMQVNDEGEYFETRDPARLAQNIGKLNLLMDRIADALSDENSDDPVADTLRDALDAAEDAPDQPRRRGKIEFTRGAKIRTRDPAWKRGHGHSAGKN